MAVLLKVHWVDRVEHDIPSLRIKKIGGVAGDFEWKHTHEQAIQFLELGRFAYYIENNSRALQLEIGHASDGRKFLKTSADGSEPMILLNLPEPTRTAT